MRDFYASSASMPLDQADGLRRLFSGTRARRFVPLVANPHVPFSGVVIERMTAAFAAAGRHTLVVDASDGAPAPHELARLDLASCVEPVGPEVSYLAARGLPLAFVDTRGSAASMLDALNEAAPQADVVLLHAAASDLARIFQRRPARPVLIGADHPESIKHAYAAVKLLSTRSLLMTFDLLLAAPPGGPRLPQIARTLGSTADGFLGCLLQHWAVVDPAAAPGEGVSAGLQRLAEAQLALDSEPRPLPMPALHPERHARA